MPVAWVSTIIMEINLLICLLFIVVQWSQKVILIHRFYWPILKAEFPITISWRLIILNFVFVLFCCFFFSESPHFIAKPPPSMTLKEKQNVILPCKAVGFPPPVISWYKDGQVIREDRREFKKRNLEIKNILFEDHGIYTCTAENLLGRIQLSVNITVKGKYCILILVFLRDIRRN